MWGGHRSAVAQSPWMNPQTSRAKSPAVAINPRTRVRTLPASQSCIDVIDTPEARTFRPAVARSAALPPGPPCASGRLADGQPEGFTPSSRATSVSQGGLTVRCHPPPLVTPAAKLPTAQLAHVEFLGPRHQGPCRRRPPRARWPLFILESATYESCRIEGTVDALCLSGSSVPLAVTRSSDKPLSFAPRAVNACNHRLTRETSAPWMASTPLPRRRPSLSLTCSRSSRTMRNQESECESR